MQYHVLINEQSSPEPLHCDLGPTDIVVGAKPDMAAVPLKQDTVQLTTGGTDSIMHSLKQHEAGQKVMRTKEGNHSQTSVLDLCSLQAESLGVISAGQTQRIKGTTC